MKERPSLIPALLCLGFVAWLAFRPVGNAPAPLPRPAGPDLVAAFAVNDDRDEAQQHAHVFATICTSLAECIEYDGQRPEPRLKTGVALDDLRHAFRQSRMKGWSFTAKYPDLAPAVETALTSAIGTSGGEITPDVRQKWVAALRQLAAAAEYAAQQG